MVELEFENGRKEFFDDSRSQAIHKNGTRALVYPYKDFDCIKITKFDDNDRRIIIPEGSVRKLKEIRELDRNDIYKVNEFFKMYIPDRKDKKFVGYTSEYIPHYHNDLTHNGRPCFNMVTMPIEQVKRYWYQMFELINFLNKKNIKINDLHRRNVVKGKDKFTIIDCDEYSGGFGEELEHHNFEELRHLFADIITAGVYFTFDVGTDSQYTENHLTDLYLNYVKYSLINYMDFDFNTIMDFLSKIEGYNTLEEFFQERNPDFVNRKLLIK